MDLVSIGLIVIVLNAFRHHRGGHGACGSGVSWTGPSAQRLSASQRWASILIYLRSSAFLCSTPFGITEVGIGRRLPGLGGLRNVLNAFRHHRGGHLSSRFNGFTRISVLNAFRHHRGGHHSAHGRCSTTLPCSTPFGITEVGIVGRPVKPILVLEVLNAFRHHRGGHDIGTDRDRAEPQCSTPFGITEVGINSQLAGCFLCACCAQRLSASQRWALLRACCGRLAHDIVLNAFRHHRGGHN